MGDGVRQLIFRGPGAAVEHERDVGSLRDPLQPGDVESRGLDVDPVRGADGDRQRVDPGLFHELRHLLRLGQHVRPGFGAFARADPAVADVPEFRFDGDVAARQGVDDFAGAADVFGERRRGGVQHDGRETDLHRAPHLVQGVRVVEMDADWRGAFLSREFGDGEPVFQPVALEVRTQRAEDHRGAELFRFLNDRARHFKVGYVEHPDRVMLRGSPREHLPKIHQTHKNLSLLKRRIVKPLLILRKNIARGLQKSTMNTIISTG